MCSLRSKIVPCISSTGTFQYSAWCAVLGLLTDPLLKEYSGALVVVIMVRRRGGAEMVVNLNCSSWSHQ